jgi:hypothetical protein
MVTSNTSFATHLATELLRLRPSDTFDVLGKAMTRPSGFCTRPAVREVMGARRTVVIGAAVMTAIFASLRCIRENPGVRWKCGVK